MTIKHIFITVVLKEEEEEGGSGNHLGGGEESLRKWDVETERSRRAGGGLKEQSFVRRLSICFTGLRLEVVI